MEKAKVKPIFSLLNRILRGQVQDIKVPKENIGENKEFKWRSSSQNGEPILIHSASGQAVSGAGKDIQEWIKPTKIEPKLKPVDSIPEGPYKGQKGYQHTTASGLVTYYPEKLFGTSSSAKTESKPKITTRILPTNRPGDTCLTPRQEKFWQAYAEKFNKVIEEGRVSDPDLVTLYSKIGEHFRTDKLSLTAIGKHCCVETGGTHCYRIQVTDLNAIPNSLGTSLHELGHGIDFSANWKSFHLIRDAIEEARQQPIPKELFDDVIKYTQERSTKIKEYKEEWQKKVDSMCQKWKNATNPIEKRKIEEEYAELTKQKKKAVLQYTEGYFEAYGQGMNALSDICDAISRGQMYSQYHCFGHGKKYFKRSGSDAKEVWADYCHLAIMHPQTLEKLNKYYPKIVEACKEMTQTMLREWGICSDDE